MEQRTGGGRNNGDMGHDLAAQAQAQLDDLRGRLGDLQENVTDFIRERPGTSLLIAVGAGFLIGRLLRS